MCALLLLQMKLVMQMEVVTKAMLELLHAYNHNHECVPLACGVGH